MRLIDADALLASIPNVSLNPFHAALEAICEAPTIDAVPVIRCAACAWRSAAGFCGRHGHPVTDDFFCAHGTTEIQKKPGPKKKAETPPETKPEAYCGITGRPCSMCRTGSCEHRR